MNVTLLHFAVVQASTHWPFRFAMAKRSADEVGAGDSDGDGDAEGSCAPVRERDIHHRIRQQAAEEQWPEGPEDMGTAFRWPEYNANKLLHVKDGSAYPTAETALRRLKEVVRVLKFDIEVHESYGGSGNGATCLHKQIAALQKDCRVQALACILALCKWNHD